MHTLKTVTAHITIIHHIPLSYVCVSVCLNRGLQKEELVLLTHGDSVDKVADGFKVVAQSGSIIAGEEHTSNLI